MSHVVHGKDVLLLHRVDVVAAFQEGTGCF